MLQRVKEECDGEDDEYNDAEHDERDHRAADEACYDL